jgi:hypothetical protein
VEAAAGKAFLFPTPGGEGEEAALGDAQRASGEMLFQGMNQFTQASMRSSRKAAGASSGGLVLQLLEIELRRTT